MKKAKPQDIVYQYVKNQIIGKSMFPGNRIIEDDIIRETGTSRTSIRPALLRLKYEGLVEMIDQKTNHIVSSLHNDTKGFPGCSPGAARGNSRSAGTFFRTNITAITGRKRFRLCHTTLSYLFCEKSQQSESTKSSQNFFAIFTENSHFAYCR